MKKKNQLYNNYEDDLFGHDWQDLPVPPWKAFLILVISAGVSLLVIGLLVVSVWYLIGGGAR